MEFSNLKLKNSYGRKKKKVTEKQPHFLCVHNYSVYGIFTMMHIINLEKATGLVTNLPS